jgi:hypothetical protein
MGVGIPNTIPGQRLKRIEKERKIYRYLTYKTINEVTPQYQAI